MSRELPPQSPTAAMMGAKSMSNVANPAVDITPLCSLAARVMEGFGAPGLIVRPDASSHDHRLRPLGVAVLQGANPVCWMGWGLAPWIADAVKSLAGDAATATLLEADGTAKFTRQCQSIPDGWTNSADRPRPVFTKTRSRMRCQESEVSV